LVGVAASELNDEQTFELSLRNRFLVVPIYLGLAGWGWWALRSTPIDAIPDLSHNEVIVFTDSTGHSRQEVEDQVTYPLTVETLHEFIVAAIKPEFSFRISSRGFLGCSQAIHCFS
jgi:Cu(I)/Ag(I) efflux system membrane protein CusA/SilA